MRRITAVVIAILFSLAATLLVLEGGVRLFRLARPAENPGWFFKVPDPITGWGHIPNSQGRWFTDLYEFDTFVSYNSREVRAPESLTYAKPAGVYRVMVLGDSFVEALQVDLADTFFEQLGRHLAGTGMEVDVIGVGAGGWGTDQALLWFEHEGVKYQPDTVILAVFPSNDFMNNTQALETRNFGSIFKPYFGLDNGELTLDYFPFNPDALPPAPQPEPDPQPQPEPQPDPQPLQSTGAWLHNHSALYRYLDPRVRIVAPGLARSLARAGLIRPGLESNTLDHDPSYTPVAYGIYAQPLDPEWAGAVDLTTALFGRLKTQVEASGANLAALIITSQEQVYQHQWQSVLDRYVSMQGRQWDPLQANRLAEAALAQADIPTLNLLPLFQEQAAQNAVLHFPQDGHWTVYGHQVTSAALFNFVAAQGIIPGLAGQSVSAPSPLAQRSLWGWFVLLILALLLFSLVWSIVKNGPVVWARDVGARFGTAGELLVYLTLERQFLMVPLVVILLLFGGLLVIAQASVVGPFIYTLF